MSMQNGEDAGDFFAVAVNVADELYKLRDNYFPRNSRNRLTRLQQMSDFSLQALDIIPPEKMQLPIQRAMYEYLRGKILDVVPVYRKEAEDHLSTAVRLNPSLVDAWACLGISVWKKGDFKRAKNCLIFALKKAPNKKILCQLSNLELVLAEDAENHTPGENVEESIKHAKKAVALDVKDGYSWYTLGNAYQAHFLVTGAWDKKMLQQALKAYKNAERDEKMMSNPGFHFNFAAVNQYLENYETALTRFEAAALKDQHAMENVKALLKLLAKLTDLVRLRIHESTSKGFSEVSRSRKSATMDLLSEGHNKGLAITGKVLFFVEHGYTVPLYYVLFDSNQTCYVASLYGIHDDAIKEGDLVSLLEPFYCFVNFVWKRQRYQFKSVQVDILKHILVNGKALSPHHAVRTSVLPQA